ncbi:MAG: hypothetical protein Q8Q39_04445, partial [bacterium]|nr:hypothetical protein [bacterium]
RTDQEGIGVGMVQQNQSVRFTVFPFDILNYQPQLKKLDKALETCDFVLKEIPIRDGCFFEI